MHLPNILRSKANHTIKLGQLIIYSLKNFFLEKSYTKCGGETIHKSFFKKSKLSICLDQKPKALYSLFLLYTKLKAIELYFGINFIFLIKPFFLHDQNVKTKM